MNLQELTAQGWERHNRCFIPSVLIAAIPLSSCAEVPESSVAVLQENPTTSSIQSKSPVDYSFHETWDKYLPDVGQFQGGLFWKDGYPIGYGELTTKQGKHCDVVMFGEDIAINCDAIPQTAPSIGSEPS